jgi:hypothetical protein
VVSPLPTMKSSIRFEQTFDKSEAYFGSSSGSGREAQKSKLSLSFTLLQSSFFVDGFDELASLLDELFQCNELLFGILVKEDDSVGSHVGFFGSLKCNIEKESVCKEERGFNRL